MSLFQKKSTTQRGRPAKNKTHKTWEKYKKLGKYSFFSGVAFIILFLAFISWSFSSFFFLVPKSFDLLGMGDQKKTYLITLHNDGELRPTLGFLTGFIFLEMENGKMNMEFHDSYDIKAPDESQKILAPDIIEERFSPDSRYQGWVFRDANFSPLHSENSEKFLEFMKYDNRYKDKKFDAVISVDLYALGKIIDSIGGVEFSGKKITGENLFSVLEESAKTFDHHSEEDWLNRKSSIKPLAQEIVKTLAFSPFHWREFSQTIANLGKEKHFLVYFKDEEIQKIFEESGNKRNWAGTFSPPENSFLLGHNIANIGGKKGDRYISKDFSSLFSISSRGKISEKLSLRLQHNGTRNINSDRYFAFIRIFREKGAVLENFSGEYINNPVQINNSQKKSLSRDNRKYENYEEFQFFIEIDESSEKHFSFKFSYPTKIDIKNQQFFLFAQAGKNSQLETQSLVFQAEGDASFVISNCDEISTQENISQCKISSSGDKIITIDMKKDIKKPLFEEVSIQDEGNKVRLQFAEEIQEIYPSSIVLQEKVTGKKIEISDLKMEKRAIILTLKTPLKKNHPFNTGEKNFYMIHIDDITDISGNSISPFRMTMRRK